MYRSRVKPWQSAAWRPSVKHAHDTPVVTEVTDVRDEKDDKESV